MEGYSCNIMINLLPQCTKCGSSVTDSIESEIEQHGKIKTGSYINGKWICDDCLRAEKKEGKEYSSSYTSQNDNSNDNECDNIGLASKSDVSPNTPKADEAML
jgi:hypothetical protein